MESQNYLIIKNHIKFLILGIYIKNYENKHCRKWFW